jgi:hypothetical protein
MCLTIFSWGYFGWGNATRELVTLVDAVETRRGFAPPVFVDIRIRRTVRAAGFSGRNFEELLGPERHVWLQPVGLIGPVQYSAGGWTFPLLQSLAVGKNTKAAVEQARDLRRRLGLNARLS